MLLLILSVFFFILNSLDFIIVFLSHGMKQNDIIHEQNAIGLGDPAYV
jgi:hypothetical protein